MLGPVFYQEMLLGGRRNQLHVFRWIYAGWLVFQIGLLFFYYSITEAGRAMQVGVAFTPSSAPEVIGSWFTSLFLYQQMILLLLATPALVAGAVADEKRRGTLQYLLLAGLDTRHILLGKLFGRVAQVALLMVAGLPLFALLAGFSGVEPLTMLVIGLVLIMPTFGVSAATLLASVFCRQTRDAVLALYLVGLFGWLLVWLIGGPLSYLDPLYVLEPAWAPMRSLNGALLAQRLVVSMIAWGTIGTVCLGVAVWQLRPVYIRELESNPLRARQWLNTERVPVHDEPIHWRERHVEGLAPLPSLKRVPQWIGLASVTLATTVACCLILAWSVKQSGSTMKDLLKAATQFNVAGLMNLFAPSWLGFYIMGVVVQLLASLVVGIRCSGSITGEREKQTWEALLLTPLSAKQMVYNKLWGVMGASYWYLLAYAAPALIFCVFGGLRSLFLTVLLIGQTALATYFIGAAGIFCSATSKNSWRSLLRTLAWGYLGGTLISLIVSPLIGILIALIMLVLYILDALMGNNLLGGSSHFALATLIAICVGFEVIFWLTAKFFLSRAQRWIADRERTRHWYAEPIYRRSRRPIVRSPSAR
jgi:ABC-type transport system involved in multi-copper enzyme maturation permease subunit